MALTQHQLAICRLIAAQRRASGESYVAGGAALNLALGAPRISRDVDLFHDTIEAVRASWIADRATLVGAGYDVHAEREFPNFVEALVSRDGESTFLQWVFDSAFRFFPLVEHLDFGLALHPFDLATNKCLALVGRIEAKDWIDVIACHERLQRFGYLAWAASGKDLGYSPTFLLAQAGRSGRYSRSELEDVQFDGPRPDPAELGRRWHEMLDEAREIVAELPPEHAGKCVLDADGDLFRGGLPELRAALATGGLRFHEGRIRGALPQIRDA
jgi:hypothetical protein